MQRSEQILEALITAKIIGPDTDKIKAATIINYHLKQLHKETVLDTITAHNKLHFCEPKFKE